ncbi:uncharacterized protein LOC118266268 [Spodoptera frugiperda]|uniref:Gustatory receptor n=1 Tax=Spodoptera frugiperda TaxID=7108 RepID=A0A9R0D007_SPOFR|nr:uncharacterized protein LOC118266268 [Spodoptera frugiperda]
MHVKTANRSSRDTYYTLVPLNYILRFFNLSCIYRKHNQLKICWSMMRSILYVMIFGFLNFFFLFKKIQRLDVIRNKTFLVTFSDTIQMSYLIGYFAYTVDLFYVYKYGRDGLLKYFKTFDHIDQILGMTCYDEIRKLIVRTLVICIVFFITSSSVDYVCWVEGFGWLSPTLYSLDYFYFFLSTLMAVDGMSHVVQLEYRLKLIKNLLQGYYNPMNTKTVPNPNKVWAVRSDTGNLQLESLKTLSHGRFIEAIGFNRCYLLLLDQTSYINSKFGVRVLIFCINLLVNMINLLNVSIRFATGSMVSPKGVSRLPSFSSLLRFLNWSAVGVSIVLHCEKVYREEEKIVEVIDLILVNKVNSDTLTTTLVNFRNLLLTRPIRFHATHFFTVRYPLLVSIISSAVTYTIIMLQSIK